MKAEFYPHINKANVFELGYVAKKSGHSRGSTVDLTIVSLPLRKENFFDNSIDMGTGFDCLDVLANTFNPNIKGLQLKNRLLLRNLMLKYGFEPYEKEWWHFTLKNEPYPDTYFNFRISKLEN